MWPWSKETKSIYKVRAQYRDPRTFPTCRLSNISDPDFHWSSGRALKLPVPDVIKYELDKDLPLEDFVITAGDPILVSPALWSQIAKSSSCARAYKSEISFRSEIREREFVTVNFECSFECLDLKRSRFSEGTYSRDKYNGFLRRSVVSEEKLPEEEDLFRLGESPVHLLATDHFKSEAAEKGLTGMEFISWPVRAGK